MSTAPTCTGRCCRATRGSPTGCSRDALARTPARRRSSTPLADELEHAGPRRVGRARTDARRPLVGSALWSWRCAHCGQTNCPTTSLEARSRTRATWSPTPVYPRTQRAPRQSTTGTACCRMGSPRPASTCSRSRTGAPASGSVTCGSPSRPATSVSRPPSSTRSRSSRSSAAAASAGRRCWCSRTRCGRAASRRIALNVFGGNDVARSLYRSVGYAETAVFMSKEL